MNKNFWISFLIYFLIFNKNYVIIVSKLELYKRQNETINIYKTFKNGDFIQKI